MKVHYDQTQDSININRKSEGFIFNQDVVNHIGKHTGKYYARIRPKTNFDGFTRFSEYLSHSEKDDNSETKDNDSFNDTSNQLSFPSVSRQSSKIVPQEIKIVQKPQSNPSKRSTELLIPVFGENSISSIKIKNNSIRPSQIKNIKQILRVMDESKDFQDEESFCVASIQRSEQNEINKNQRQTETLKRGETGNLNEDKKQSVLRNEFLKQNKVNKEKENRKSLLRKSPQKILSEEENKQRRKSRVSFTQTVVVSEFGHQSPKHSQQFKKQEEQHKIQDTQILLSQIRMSRQFPKQQKPEADSRAMYEKKIVKIKEQETYATLEQAENTFLEKQDNFSNHYYEPQQYGNYENVEYVEDKKQEVNELKLNKRQLKKNKQFRITDRQTSVDRLSNDDPSIQLQKKKTNKTKKPIQSRRGIFENQSNKLHNHKKQICEYKNQQGNHSQPSQTQRYPKRTRIRPVSYWQNQKVHYKAGIAIGIERATLNIQNLLQTNQNYFQHVFHLSLHNNEIEIEMILPAKKEFHSKGIKSPYQTLLISISQKSKQIEKPGINFEDGIRSEVIEHNKIIEVPQGRQFQIQNEGIYSIFLQMKLI